MEIVRESLMKKGLERDIVDVLVLPDVTAGERLVLHARVEGDTIVAYLHPQRMRTLRTTLSELKVVRNMRDPDGFYTLVTHNWSRTKEVVDQKDASEPPVIEDLGWSPSMPLHNGHKDTLRTALRQLFWSFVASAPTEDMYGHHFAEPTMTASLHIGDESTRPVFVVKQETEGEGDESDDDQETYVRKSKTACIDVVMPRWLDSCSGLISLMTAHVLS
jgi:hypothetical protein